MGAACRWVVGWLAHRSLLVNQRLDSSCGADRWQQLRCLGAVLESSHGCWLQSTSVAGLQDLCSRGRPGPDVVAGQLGRGGDQHFKGVC